MSKQITRSVTVYKYTFVKMEKDDGGKLQVTDTKEADFLQKLGTRGVNEYIKSREDLTGYTLGKMEQTSKTYAMALDAFVAAAKQID